MGKKKNDSLGDRMKQNYEYVPRTYLTRRVPVIIRLDGKAFHTFTKGMKKPFDKIMMTTMQRTMQFLCKNIQGCVFGYTQSDEITLVLTDYATITTDAWFGYNVQKMTSVAASMATVAFNRFFVEEVEGYLNDVTELMGVAQEDLARVCAARMVYHDKLKCKFWSAMFDARAFSIPKDEVCNCLIWRQQDATRNSIEAAGQAYFSAKQLHEKTCNMIQEMLWSEKGINWNDYPTDCKRGSCCYRVTETVPKPNPRNNDEVVNVTRRRWVIDREIPIFTQDREFVERWL